MTKDMKNLSKPNGLEHQKDVIAKELKSGHIEKSFQNPAIVIRHKMAVETLNLSLQYQSTESMEFSSVQSEVKN